MTEADTRNTVRTLLALHGLRPGPEDFAAIVVRFAARRQAAEMLYGVPVPRQEDPQDPDDREAPLG